MGFLLSAKALVEVGGDAEGDEGVGVLGCGHGLVLAGLGGGPLLSGPAVNQVPPVEPAGHDDRGGGQDIPDVLVRPQGREGGGVQTLNSQSEPFFQTL